jgi:DNA-binding response OmpR family regulator
MKILVVDDDADLLDLTGYALRREGFTVVQAVDGEQALQRWERESPDLVLLDANMPKMNGFEVCQRIRQSSTTPVIMLTARDDEEDILQGLELGADDYVTKPFSAKQLIARIKAVIRRCQGDPFRQPVSELRAGDLVLDLQSHEARKGGAVVQLTPLEFRLLYMLTMNEGRVIPYDRIVEYAWGYDGGDSSLLKTHMSHIRSKLGIGATGSGAIRAIPGVGYSLNRSET